VNTTKKRRGEERREKKKKQRDKIRYILCRRKREELT